MWLFPALPSLAPARQRMRIHPIAGLAALPFAVALVALAPGVVGAAEEGISQVCLVWADANPMIRHRARAKYMPSDWQLVRVGSSGPVSPPASQIPWPQAGVFGDPGQHARP
jgi:hypothetical protein